MLKSRDKDADFASLNNSFFSFSFMGWCIYLEFLEAAAEIVKSHLFLHFFFKFHKEYSHQGKCPMSLIRFDVLGMLQISQKSVFLFA